MQARTVYRGTAFTCDERDVVVALPDHVFEVDAAGLIVSETPASTPAGRQLLAATGDALVEAAPGQFFLPGFIDLHVHAPQWAQAGTALDRPLAEWLHAYTFKLEAQFSDVAFARRVYRHLVAALLARGTTTALYFATVHREASLALAEICADAGQRGLVGKVVMDDPDTCPEHYRDADAATAIAETERFIGEVRALRASTGAEVYPVVTPRFIPSCTDDALRGLGELAGRLGVHVQSHCSESDWEHGYVLERLGVTDAEALDSFGLLRANSVMAHCGMLTDADAARFAATGTAVAHCPLSNAFFGDAVAPIRRFLDAGVEVGLGTDISGGYAPSMWDALRQAVTSSRMLASGVDARLRGADRGVPDSRITFDQAFALATAAGGRSLELPIGRLAEGFAWDAQLVDVRAPRAELPIFGDEDLGLLLQKMIALASAENIRTVWVQGRKVTSRV